MTILKYQPSTMLVEVGTTLRSHEASQVVKAADPSLVLVVDSATRYQTIGYDDGGFSCDSTKMCRRLFVASVLRFTGEACVYV